MDGLVDLIRQAQDGDDAAFNEIVRLTLPGTYRFLRSLGASEDDAADAAQEAYVRAWRALGRFDAERPFNPWLYQIAKRALSDARRTQARYVREQDDESQEMANAPDPEPLPDALFAREETRRHVRKALEELSANERVVLSLRYDEEFSFEEISQTLSMPAGTVRSIHHRALARLRELLRNIL